MGSVVETLDGDAESSLDPSLHNGMLTFQRCTNNAYGTKDLFGGQTEDNDVTEDFNSSDDEEMTVEDRML